MNKRIREKKLKQFFGQLAGDHPTFYPFPETEGYVSITELTIPQIKDHIRNHPEKWFLDEFGFVGRIKKGISIEIDFDDDNDEMVVELYKNIRCVGKQRFYSWANIKIEESQLK